MASVFQMTQGVIYMGRGQVTDSPNTGRHRVKLVVTISKVPDGTPSRAAWLDTS